jgi:hypothetical protein
LADTTAGVDVRGSFAATAPVLDWLWIAVLVSAGVFLVLGALVVALAVPRSGGGLVRRRVAEG